MLGKSFTEDSEALALIPTEVWVPHPQRVWPQPKPIYESESVILWLLSSIAFMEERHCQFVPETSTLPCPAPRSDSLMSQPMSSACSYLQEMALGSMAARYA